MVDNHIHLLLQHDISVAFQKTAAEECSTEEASPACMEYEERLMELTRLLEEQTPRVAAIRNVAEGIRKIRMADPSSMSTALASGADPASDTAAYKSSLEDMRVKAEAASKKFGATSAEARVAWTEYEEVASSGAQTAMGDRLDEMCLVETQAMEACEALEELSRVLNLQKSKGRYQGWNNHNLLYTVACEKRKKSEERWMNSLFGK